MPLYHCDKCHHEFETSKPDPLCNWCGATAYILKSKTELETFIKDLIERRKDEQ